MKLVAPLNFPLKMFKALGLTLFAGFSLNASAGDIPANDPSAPCGVLKQVGHQAAIYNNSNFTFNVRFESEWIKLGPFRSVNAGAVKYLDYDANNQGIWRDTGEGDYLKIKKYTIPVAHNQAVQIAYCADSSMGWSPIKGKVYYETDSSEGQHNVPQSPVEFYDKEDYVVIYRAHLFRPYDTPFVKYNVDVLGEVAAGSLVLCPKDSYCRIQ